MPGSVQGYGVLLVADAHSRKVSFVSENAPALLGLATTEILNKTYLSLTEAAAERRVMQDQIAPDTILFPNPVRLTIRGRAFDAVFHAQGPHHLIEIEPAPEGGTSYADMSNRAVEELFDPQSVEELYQRAVQVVRAVTGFDRVMLYRFDERYNGQVLAESTRGGIGSFLGLFFPSSDISARASFERNPSGRRCRVQRASGRYDTCQSAQRGALPHRISDQYGREGVDVLQHQHG